MTTPTQGEHAQTEALRLADDLEASSLFPGNMRSCNNAAAAELRRLHAQVVALTATPGVQANTKTHALLSTMIGLFLRAKEKIGYQPGSAIDKTVAEAVEHLKDWPYPETAAPAQPAAPQGVAYAELPASYQSSTLIVGNDGCTVTFHFGTGCEADVESWLSAVTERASHGQAPAAGAVAGPSERKVFLVATGAEHEGEATYTRYDDAPPPLCDSECLYTAAPTPAAQADSQPAPRWSDFAGDLSKQGQLVITLENVNEGKQWHATSNHSERIVVGQFDALEALRLALENAGNKAGAA